MVGPGTLGPSCAVFQGALYTGSWFESEAAETQPGTQMVDSGTQEAARPTVPTVPGVLPATIIAAA